MSWEACAWAWKQDLLGTEKWVLMGLANYASEEWESWPSLRTLSRKLGLSRPTVIKKIEALIDQNLISKVTRKNRSNIYKLHQDGGQVALPGGQVALPVGGQVALPNPSIFLTHKQTYSLAFEEFWKVYPNRKGRGHALKAWMKISPPPPLAEKIMCAVREQVAWRDSANGEFRPAWKHPATWLNGQCWEDEDEIESIPAESPIPVVKSIRDGVVTLGDGSVMTKKDYERIYHTTI